MNISEKTISLTDRPIFLISSARSGTTWLQKIINVHPSIVMWGEHSGFLRGVSESYQSVMNEKLILDRDEENMEKEFFLEKNTSLDFNPVWMNSFSKESMKLTYRDFVVRTFADDVGVNSRWGFKEIRYCEKNVLNFLLSLFPSAQFIFLERNIIDVCRSQVLSLHCDIWDMLTVDEKRIMIIELIGRIEYDRKEIEKFKRSVNCDSNNVFLDIRYEELINSFDIETNKLFSFIGGCLAVMDDYTLDGVRRCKVHPSGSDESLTVLINNVIKNNQIEINKYVKKVAERHRLPRIRSKVHKRCIAELREKLRK